MHVLVTVGVHPLVSPLCGPCLCRPCFTDEGVEAWRSYVSAPASGLADGDRDLKPGTSGSKPVPPVRTRSPQGHCSKATPSPGLPLAALRVSQETSVFLGPWPCPAGVVLRTLAGGWAPWDASGCARSPGLGVAPARLGGQLLRGGI